MEDRPASSASVGPVADSSPASAEPVSSRRRAGGQKRKAAALLSSSGSSPAPSKRLTREKQAASAAISLIPLHNGPLTRASRMSPANFASLASLAAIESMKLEEKAHAVASDVTEGKEAINKLEAAMEVEFESIRSRDGNAHIVPSHCGWFSWTKLHPLEERALPSFFTEKSQTRTPDAYMLIRNWIVKKFHRNPNVQMELKDLSELEVLDLDARQEVFEFLDYWGLINFHPSLEADPISDTDVDGTMGTDTLLEKLFRFEEVQPCCQQVISKPNLTTMAVPSGLFPETAFAEEMARLEGPSVDYHCNSCSADCSRKRYHCQKQADYDLCADCFNNGKFGSNMSSSDFILMEPADGPGLSGGKWTDQETLLLLEALELYRENWTEIAEHVATKTKAQCILHFVQMPIADAFYGVDDDRDGNLKETAAANATIDDTSTAKDVSETNEDKICMKEDQPTAQSEASKPEDPGEVKVSSETAKPENACEVLIEQETSKPVVGSEEKTGQDIDENVVLKALTEAFSAVGCYPTPETHLSFAEVGNPVMALATFLGRLVGADVATAAARSSLKSLSSKSPGIDLAARQCFLLEDPPDDIKEQSALACLVAETAEETATNINHEGKSHTENKLTAPLDDKGSSNDQADKENEDSLPAEKQPQDSSDDKSIEKVNAGNEVDVVSNKELEHSKLDSSNSEAHKDIEKESDEKPSNLISLPTSAKDQQEGSSAEDDSQLPEAAKDMDVSDSNPSEKNESCQLVRMIPVEETSEDTEASKDADMVPDSTASDTNELQQPVKCSHPSQVLVDIDMSSSLPSQVQEHQQQSIPNSMVEKEATTADDPTDDNNKEKPDRQVIKDDKNIDKVKCAAVSTLSAAAVKAKLLANQEEDQIRQLCALLIEKQLHKLESKLTFFNDMDGAILRVKEQLERSRQKLYQERAHIIATRFGLPSSSSRVMPQSLPANRFAMNFANSVARPPMSQTSLRPPISRPMGILAPNSSNPFVSTTSAGNYLGPAGQDKISSVRSK